MTTVNGFDSVLNFCQSPYNRICTIKPNNEMNQSEFKAKTWNQNQARETRVSEIANDFSFVRDWLTYVVRQKHRKMENRGNTKRPFKVNRTRLWRYTWSVKKVFSKKPYPCSVFQNSILFHLTKKIIKNQTNTCAAWLNIALQLQPFARGPVDLRSLTALL